MPYSSTERRNARQRARYAESAEFRAKKKARHLKQYDTPLGVAKQKLIGSRITARSRGYQPCASTPQDLVDSFTGECEICKSLGTMRELHLDHCHSTGNFRGWLCSGCNHALGNMRENPALLVAAAHYLLGR